MPKLCLSPRLYKSTLVASLLRPNSQKKSVQIVLKFCCKSSMTNPVLPSRAEVSPSSGYLNTSNKRSTLRLKCTLFFFFSSDSSCRFLTAWTILARHRTVAEQTSAYWRYSLNLSMATEASRPDDISRAIRLLNLVLSSLLQSLSLSSPPTYS